MARCALQISIRDVAKMSLVAPATVSRLEAGIELKPRTVNAIRRAFEERGVEFLDGDAPGVRLHPRPQPRKKR